ncbi:PAS domain-containing protein [Nisaea nitritireducens]|uniref:PAS domain-containing protein n=1 Tax=Nisaea nitritireducens TaxID=568392 RepID=UPI0018678742|nr:PAS domain-containing protein [Nisaea nitritireducens]
MDRSVAAKGNATYRGATPNDIATYSRAEFFDLSLIAEPNLRRIADYWLSRCNGRRMPGRTDIDPIDIPWALSRLFLVDYDRETEEYSYRVAGNEVEEIFSRFTEKFSMRDVNLDEMLPLGSAPIVHERWRPLVQNGDIVYMSGLVYAVAERIPLGARILLPLSDREDGKPSGLIGYTECEWGEYGDGLNSTKLDIHYIPLPEPD